MLLAISYCRPSAWSIMMAALQVYRIAAIAFRFPDVFALMSQKSG
jgi:hypothetical protein